MLFQCWTQRLRRWSNIETALDEYPVFAGIAYLGFASIVHLYPLHITHTQVVTLANMSSCWHSDGVAAIPRERVGPVVHDGVVVVLGPLIIHGSACLVEIIFFT